MTPKPHLDMSSLLNSKTPTSLTPVLLRRVFHLNRSRLPVMGAKVTAFFHKCIEIATTASPNSFNHFHPPETGIASLSTANTTPAGEASHSSGSTCGYLKKRKMNTTPVTPSTRTVFLSEWWLDVARDDRGGKCLAVGGKTYSRLRMPRIFTSGPIYKRIDAYTFETRDGFTVIIDGLIDKYRTESNGFCAQASSDFLMGFPYNWESYASDYFAKTTSPERHDQNASDSADLIAEANISCPPPIPRDGSPTTKLLSFIKLAEYDCYNLSRNRIPDGQGMGSHRSEVLASQHRQDTRKCNSPFTQAAKRPKYSNHYKGGDNSVGENCDHGTLQAEVLATEPFIIQEGIMHDDTMKIEQDCDFGKSKMQPFLPRRSPRLLKAEEKFESLDSKITYPGSRMDAQPRNVKVGESRNHKLKEEVETDPQTPVATQCSREKAGGRKKEKVKSELKTFPSTAVSLPSNAKVERRGMKEVKEEPYTPYVKQGLFTRETVKSLFLSPESLDLKRSRSGRVLIPKLEVHQTVVYDADGTVVGIKDTHPSEASINSIESKSVSARKIRSVRRKK